jgi:hypothetical protein
MSKAHRQYPRFETNTEARMRLLGGANWSDVKVVNLSKGGACIHSETPYNQTSVIELIINSPNPDIRIHNFMARIVWSEGAVFGIQFITRL